MTRILMTLMTIFSASLAAAAQPTSFSNLYVYKCGERSVTVSTDGPQFKIAMSYRTKSNHVVNIQSGALSVDQLTVEFTGQGILTTAADAQQTGLAAGSLAFSGFHYAQGAMFIAAEGDTNEQGYVFAVEQSLLRGDASAEAADVFWSDRSAGKVSKYSCVRVNQI